MPEITDAQEREYRRYQELGTPDTLAEKVKKVSDLETDNKTLRDERKELRAKVPGEDAVVLTADQAKKWAKVAEVDVDDLIVKAADSIELRKDLAKREARDNAHKAAEAAGLNPDAYMALPGALELAYEVKSETVDGKQVERAYVKDADGKESALSLDFVKGREGWKPLAAAVEAKPAEQQQDRRWLEQRNGDGAGKEKDVVGAHLGSTYVTPSKRNAS